MVLVALDHPDHAVDARRLPGGSVGRAGSSPRLIPKPCDSRSALVDDVEPVLVAEVVETRIVRIVRGADRVDVVPLHQHHVPHHGLERHGPAEIGVMLVPVDALEHDAYAVDQKVPVPHLARSGSRHADGDRLRSLRPERLRRTGAAWRGTASQRSTGSGSATARVRCAVPSAEGARESDADAEADELPSAPTSRASSVPSNAAPDVSLTAAATLTSARRGVASR